MTSPRKRTCWIVAATLVLVACGGCNTNSHGVDDVVDGGGTDTDPVFFSGTCTLPPWESGDPELPKVVVDTEMPQVVGTTIQVNSGDDLQEALNQAQPGDEIVLEAGATFTGHFQLPAKDGDDWIIVRSSEESSLPVPGRRVAPTDAVHMPKLKGTNTLAVLTAAKGAHHYRLIGLEVEPRSDGFVYGLIDLGDTSESDPILLEHHFVFDRMYVHSFPGQDARRGFNLNVAHGAVIDSYVSGFYQVGSQSQAILAFHTPGPLRFVNNFLSAASEVILFGGADNQGPEFIPQDIEICHNYFFKPNKYNPEDPDYPGPIDGRHHFESKMSKRVLLSGNIMENNWNGAYGYAISIKVSNENGGNPWAQSNDYTIAYNYIVNSDYGAMLLGLGDGVVDQPNQRLKMVHNLLVDIRGRMFLLGNGLDELRILNNTIIGNGADAVAVFVPDTSPPFDENTLSDFDKMAGFLMNNNIAVDADYSLIAGGMGSIIDTIITVFFEDPPSFDKNVLAETSGDVAAFASQGIDIVDNVTDIGFVDFGGGDYRLSATSSYASAGTDGNDYGADIDAVAEATDLDL